MNLSDQKLNEILKQIIETYGTKGSITTNALCDIMEKYETTPALVINNLFIAIYNSTNNAIFI